MKWLPLFLVVLATSTGCSNDRTTATERDSGTGVNSGPCVTPPEMNSLIDQNYNDSQRPWRREGAGEVVIYFATAGIPADWRSYMEYGSEQWNKSPCIDTRVTDACPPSSNCVTVSVIDSGDDGNFNADERNGFTVGGHIDYRDSLTPGQKKNVAVHEMGHAVGLRHRKTEHVLMNGQTYDDVFDPDVVDYLNLRFEYGQQLRND